MINVDIRIMSSENNNNENRCIDDIGANDPWITNNMPDIDRQSSMLAEHYIDNHLLGDPNGANRNKMWRDIESFYSITDPTHMRFTLRKIAQSPKTDSAITDFTKSDDYFVTYKHD